MNQLNQRQEQEPFAGITLTNLVNGLEAETDCLRYCLTILHRLRKGYERDRHILSQRYREIVDCELDDLEKDISKALDKDMDNPLFIPLINQFVSILNLFREIHFRDKQCLLERARRDEARSMVQEILTVEPCLRGAIHHLIRHELYQDVKTEQPEESTEHSPLSNWLSESGFSAN